MARPGRRDPPSAQSGPGRCGRPGRGLGRGSFPQDVRCRGRDHRRDGRQRQERDPDEAQGAERPERGRQGEDHEGPDEPDPRVGPASRPRPHHPHGGNSGHTSARTAAGSHRRTRPGVRTPSHSTTSPWHAAWTAWVRRQASAP